MSAAPPAPEDGREGDHLDLEDLLEIAQTVLGQVVVRDVGALAAAAARPHATAFGRAAYPDLAARAGALMHSLARSHPLVDGNKRLAWVATRTYLLLNGADLVMGTDQAEAFVLAVATGDLDAAGAARVIAAHQR